MAWIESHQSLSRHRKTLRAVALLHVDRHKLLGHLHEMWWWGLDNVPADGVLDGISDEELAAGAQWRGDATTFVRALITAGFIDVDDEDRRWLHDWYDYAGKLLERRAANAERMRNARAKNVQRTCETRAGATVPNPTEHNPTIPDNGERIASEPTPPVPTKAPDADAPAPPEKPKRGKSEKGEKPKGLSHQPIHDAFDAAGIPRLVIETGKEKAAAQFLLKYFPNNISDVPECMDDIASGRYGRDYERSKLSLALLVEDNHFQNWLRWKSEGKPPMARVANRNGKETSNVSRASDREYLEQFGR